MYCGTYAPRGAGVIVDKDLLSNKSYLASTDSDWQISIPAAGFTKSEVSGQQRWQISDSSDHVRAKFMQVSPARGALVDSEYVQLSPRLDYSVTFKERGIYYVWVHGRGLTDDASLHVGLDGNPLISSDNIHGFGPKGRRFHWRIPWPIRRSVWSRSTLNRVPAHIEITETGTHSLNVWMRSDDLAFDQIILTSKNYDEPQWDRPPASSLDVRKLQPPIFSRSSGVYNEKVDITITSRDSGNKIWYTLDESDPATSRSARKFNGPVEISETKTIRAIARSTTSAHSDSSRITLTKLQCEPIRIMPLGDSITLGIFGPVHAGPLLGTRVGYRAPLYRLLIQAGFSVDFVGQLQAGALVEPPIDPDHEGHDGWTSEQIAERTYEILRRNSPDIILLHIGTNGLTVDTSSVDFILSEVDRFERDFEREILVLLARIINRSTFHAETRQYNENLERLATTRRSEGDKILTVDMEDALQYPDDLYDKLHPNSEGYARMSKVWFAALEPLLSSCGHEPAALTQPESNE